MLILGGSGFLLLVGTVLCVVILWHHPWFQSWVFEQSIQAQVRSGPHPPGVALVPFPGPRLQADSTTTANDIFRPTNVWEAHLSFTSPQWDALGPHRVPPVDGWLLPDGTPLLRNPRAARAGIAGVLGWDLPWSAGGFEFAGLDFTNAAVRFKGNGTFLASLGSYRRPFKIDLDKNVPDRRLAGLRTVNLHNLEADPSFLRDTLAYEFFRDAGVQAPRTTFVRLFLTIDPRWDRRLLGLYLMVENPDTEWVDAAFHGRNVTLFKPVSHELFRDLGTRWHDYAEVYDPKSKLAAAQQQRLIDLCRLTTQEDAAEFNRRIGDYIDLDEFARFLACTALLANYDSILDNGQNFLMWLDSETGRFGFSPWDLDHSWGEFPFVGDADQRERASLFHPWVGRKRFLERMLATPGFRDRYRQELTRILDSLFIPDRLDRRIDELAAVVRPAIAEFSNQRLAHLETALGSPDSESKDARQKRPKRGAYSLKRFIAVRASEARAQLDGRSEGVILRRHN